MILPSKHLSQDRALLTVGAQILQRLHQPMTISALWEEIPRQNGGSRSSGLTLSYDGFILALDLLFFMDAINLQDGLLTRKTS